MKLTYSLLLLVFSIIIIAEITGIWILYEFKNTLENQIINDSEKLNIMMINRIDGYVTERLVDLMNLVGTGAFQAEIQESNTQFSKMSNPEQYMDKMDSVWTSTPSNETTPFMKTLIDSKSSEQLRQIENNENKLFHGKVYGEIFMTNAYGANVIESDKTSDYKQSDEAWWQETRKNGIYVGGVEFDKSSGISSYTVAVRLDDENGNFIGVAKAVVNIEQIINMIKAEMDVGVNTKPIEYELLRTDDSIIYSTNINEKPNSLSDISTYKDKLKNVSGHFSYTEDDQIYLVTYSHSSISKFSPFFDWIFTTTYKSSEILEHVVRVTSDMTTLTAISIAIISITVFTISRKLGSPIEKIQQAILEFSQGNKIEIKPHGTLEVKNLISGFNSMIEEIEVSQNIISKSEEKFRMLFELSPVAIGMADENGRFISVNKRFLEIFGYDHDNEIIGKLIPTIITERSQHQFEEFQSRLTEKIIGDKVWFVKKDKTEFPGLVNAQKIYDSNKKLIGMIGAIQDISDIEEMTQQIRSNEIELAKSENLYKELFELSPDPIRISTLDRVTIDVNQSFLKKFGYTKEEIVGKSIYENIDNSSRADIENAFNILRERNNVDNMETTYHTKDGRKIPVLLSVSSYHDQLGNLIGNIAIIKDISDIYSTRQEIIQKIENVLAQNTQIKYIEEQKDRFASMISHELTTPLFPIKFQAEMLKDPKIFGKLNKEQTNSVNEIYQNATRLERLIEDILDAQKLEMNAMKFIKSDFELKEFMNQIVNLGKNIIANKEIAIENSTKDQITLISDSDRLIQVFSNLIKNSVDFVPEKIGKIEIGAKIQENDVLFYVKDNGNGIPKNKQENLFRRFYQIDTTHKRNHRGSGLGLSICKGIVEGLGGKIWLESTENVGTIVYFTIPKGDTN